MVRGKIGDVMSVSKAILVRPGLELSVQDLEAICQRFDVAELGIFGSSVNGTFTPNSDVDILVKFREGARVGMVRFLTLRDELSKLLGRKVDLVSKPGLNPEIRAEVLANSRVLYAA